MKWELDSNYIPLISHIAPSDTFLFYKKGIVKAIVLYIYKKLVKSRRVLFIEISSLYMRKFLLIEGYLIGENELNEETPKEKKQS